VKVRVQGSGSGVSVVAGGKAAPEAGPLENKGVQGPFRHPVYGNMRVWVSQDSHPFFHPAVDAARDKATKAALAALNEAFAAVVADMDAEGSTVGG
jgi:hypothetical protein